MALACLRVLLFAFLLRPVSTCSTFVVGKSASKDGAVMLTQSADAEYGFDARLCYVPAKDLGPNATRPVYFAFENYPRYIGSGRGTCYEPSAGQTPYKPMGYIPEVSHTYSYFDGTFGIVNEHGVGIGETTCSGMFATRPISQGGRALLSIDELSHIALERTRTARDAVKIMGELAEKHGWYGSSDDLNGGAESLMVGDADEAFIFHILADPTGTSAIWVAQRVPDDHVAAVTNMFTIRDLDFNDTENFLIGNLVRSVAEERGWWKPGQKMDFTATYSHGEYTSIYYSGHRMWDAYRHWGINFTDTYTNLRYDRVYPTTAKFVKPLGVQDLFATHRSHYEGTKYDMTKGLAAGPFGDPDRFMPNKGQTVVGNWERALGIFRSGYTVVAQLKHTGQGSLFWFAPHASASSCFVPISNKMTEVPPAYMIANPDPDGLTRDSAYWAHRYVFSVAKIMYNHAMENVTAVQHEMENAGVQLVETIDGQAHMEPTQLNKMYGDHANNVVRAFWALPDKIVARYSDGWLADKANVGYPDWWLKAVGYEQGPAPIPHVTLPAPSPRSQCDDLSMQGCIADCPSTVGFASCAIACARACDSGPSLSPDLMV